ncbi:MAG: energy-coupling factor transporter transmembrane component T [Candidatus Thorarchaeota archaeon]|nr:energy-coupling factor transporter transmembrane component T [Candidatus Thorarchaeota archaeon]
MGIFLLPFREGQGALDRFSPTAIFVSAVGVGVITAIQTDVFVILTLLLMVLLGAVITITRWRVVLSLVAKFEIFILFWMFLMPFVYGETLLFAVPLPWGFLNAYQEGLEFGFLLGFRMMTMIILFIASLSHMSLSEFIGALRTLKVPVSILGSLLIMLRYIPLFIGERSRMQDAQSLRGYERGGSFEKIKSLGYLIGSTIDRAFDRSLSVYDAMTLRGFGGGMVVRSAGFRRGDVFLIFLLLVFSIFVMLFVPDLLAVIIV